MAARTLSEECGVGSACRGCGRRLPLRFSQFGEEAALWECIGCLSPFAGTLLPEMVAMLAPRVRLSQRHFDTVNSPPLPLTLRQVVEHIHATEPTAEIRDLRRSNRLAGMRHTEFVRLNATYGVTGAALHGTIVNMSPHGLLLVTGAPIDATAFIAQIAGPRHTLQLLARIVWKQHFGGGCYGTGAEFIARFGRVDR